MDGYDLRELDLMPLTKHFGMVPQEICIFQPSLRENLLDAKLQIAQDELEETCRAANIQGVFAWLPEGNDAIVVDDGPFLSISVIIELCNSEPFFTYRMLETIKRREWYGQER